MMADNTRANKAYDSGLLSTFETGSAFALDKATYAEDQVALKDGAPVPGAQSWTYAVRSFGIPRHGGAHPHWLVAGVQRPASKTSPASPNCVLVFDLEAAKGGSGWRIGLEPTLPPGALPALAVGPDGYQRSLTAADQQNARSIPKAVVKALLQDETTGASPSLKTTDFVRPCGPIPNPRLDVLNEEFNGLTAKERYSVVHPSDTTAVPLVGGNLLVLFTLRYSRELDAAGSQITWSHAASPLNPLLPSQYLLAAGTYSKVTETGLLQLAAVVSAAGQFSLVGSYGGITGITGVKAGSATPPTSGTLTSKVLPTG
jgi:hypothetical protein